MRSVASIISSPPVFQPPLAASLSKLGVLLFAVEVISKIPVASAGPATFAACMAGVVAFSGPAAVALWQSCLPFLGPWCP